MCHHDLLRARNWYAGAAPLGNIGVSFLRGARRVPMPVCCI